MPRIYDAPACDAVVRALTEHGEPMSAAELELELGLKRNTINWGVTTAKKRGLVYIHSFPPRLGVQGRRAPMYWLGNEPDAKEPKANIKAIKKRSADKLLELKRLKTQQKRGKLQDPWLRLLAGKSMAYCQKRVGDE